MTLINRDLAVPSPLFYEKCNINHLYAMFGSL